MARWLLVTSCLALVAGLDKKRWQAPIRSAIGNSTALVDLSFGSGVSCGQDRECPNSAPICCEDDTGDEEFCIPGGSFCCPVLPPLNKYAFCNLGETCCTPPPCDGCEPACCNSSQTCVADSPSSPYGKCEHDVCEHEKDSNDCLRRGDCGWCCATNRCQSARNLCNASQWLTNTSQSCPDVCSVNTGCEECSASNCGWCCQTGTCMSSQGDCSHYQYILPGFGDQQCADCEVGGSGLFPVPTPMATFVFFFVLLPAFCVCFAFVLLIRYCCANCLPARQHTEPLLAGANDATDSSLPANIQSSDEASFLLARLRAHPKKVTKYGFDNDNSSPSVGSAIWDVSKTPSGSAPRDAEWLASMVGSSAGHSSSAADHPHSSGADADHRATGEASSAHSSDHVELTIAGSSCGSERIPIPTVASSGTLSGSPEAGSNVCAICMASTATVIFLPCYHLCSCSACANRLEVASTSADSLLCPFCRNPIETMVNLTKVYTNVRDTVKK